MIEDYSAYYGVFDTYAEALTAHAAKTHLALGPTPILISTLFAIIAHCLGRVLCPKPQKDSGRDCVTYLDILLSAFRDVSADVETLCVFVLRIVQPTRRLASVAVFLNEPCNLRLSRKSSALCLSLEQVLVREIPFQSPTLEELTTRLHDDIKVASFLTWQKNIAVAIVQLLTSRARRRPAVPEMAQDQLSLFDGEVA